jgi:hypothetical protein
VCVFVFLPRSRPPPVYLCTLLIPFDSLTVELCSLQLLHHHWNTRTTQEEVCYTQNSLRMDKEPQWDCSVCVVPSPEPEPAPRTAVGTTQNHSEWTQNHPKPPLGLTRNTLVTQNTPRTTRNVPRTTQNHSECAQNHSEPPLGPARNTLVTQNTLRTTWNYLESPKILLEQLRTIVGPLQNGYGITQNRSGAHSEPRTTRERSGTTQCHPVPPPNHLEPQWDKLKMNPEPHSECTQN